MKISGDRETLRGELGWRIQNWPCYHVYLLSQGMPRCKYGLDGAGLRGDLGGNKLQGSKEVMPVDPP